MSAKKKATKATTPRMGRPPKTDSEKVKRLVVYVEAKPFGVIERRWQEALKAGTSKAPKITSFISEHLAEWADGG